MLIKSSSQCCKIKISVSRTCKRLNTDAKCSHLIVCVCFATSVNLSLVWFLGQLWELLSLQVAYFHHKHTHMCTFLFILSMELNRCLPPAPLNFTPLITLYSAEATWGLMVSALVLGEIVQCAGRSLKGLMFVSTAHLRWGVSELPTPGPPRKRMNTGWPFRWRKTNTRLCGARSGRQHAWLGQDTSITSPILRARLTHSIYLYIFLYNSLNLL